MKNSHDCLNLSKTRTIAVWASGKLGHLTDLDLLHVHHTEIQGGRCMGGEDEYFVVYFVTFYFKGWNPEKQKEVKVKDPEKYSGSIQLKIELPARDEWKGITGEVTCINVKTRDSQTMYLN